MIENWRLRIGDCRLKIENFHSGQVAIIVMLVSALMITVGLSLSKKTTVETKIDFNEEALKKAFNAAESGIDYYLATGQKIYDSNDSLSEANVVTEDIGGEGILNFGELTPANGVQYFWLTNHDLGGSLGTGYFTGDKITVIHNWPTTDNSALGSLEINIFYQDGGIYGVKRYGYNFSNTPSRQVSYFNDGRIGYQNITITGLDSIPNKILMTVTPIFNGANLSVSGNGSTFPIQGETISSTGSAGVIFDDTEEETKINKKLSIERRYEIPYFLLSGIVSESQVLSQ
ncbi:MAG: pilus assembly PilX N-terminal domain-containing protein [Candidatus Shapirobacteria bacterium]|nr:pilus assembly PilX N-terminal domain-containing protein [Candidatus Shapirobacteria bacterium]